MLRMLDCPISQPADAACRSLFPPLGRTLPLLAAKDALQGPPYWCLSRSTTMLPLYNLPIFFVVGPDFRHSFLLLEPQFMSIQLSKLWALGSNCRPISRCNLMQVFVFKTANYSSIILSSESSDSIIVFTTWSKRAIVTNYNTFPSFFKCFLKPEGCDFE